MSPTQAAKQLLGGRGIDITVKVIAIVSLVLAIVVGVQQYRLATCVAAYDDAFARSSRARAASNDQDKAAEDAMWQAFQDAADPRKVPPAQARDYAKAAFDRYLQQRMEARQARAEHPLPAPPSKTC